MIVKNEEHVIERSLHSALPHVDRWCIVDTGSTDSTKEKIHSLASKYNKPGMLYERPWINFGHNRTELLELSRAWYSDSFFMMLDADDIFMCDAAATATTADAATEADATDATLTSNPVKISLKEQLGTQDAYSMIIKRGNLTYKRPVIFNSKPWVYKGVLHEYAHLDNATIGNILPHFWIDARVEGARSLNPNKYRDDALMLEEEFKKNPDTRTAFYTAQSWRDSGNSEKATEWYLRRIELGGWNQEIYISYLNLIQLTDDISSKFKYAWKSLRIAPRLETAHCLLEYLRRRNEWSEEAYYLGLAFAEKGRVSADDLFTEMEMKYKFYDEISIHSFYTGHDNSAILYGMRAYFAAPSDQRERILNNVRFSVKDNT